MMYRVLADLVMLLHFAFVAFVVGGGLLVLWRRRLAWLHLPVVLYGASLELAGWVCPLTPVEQRLRRAAGGAGYEGGFIDHYLEGILYPGSWGDIHVWLGVLLLAGNAVIYIQAFRRRRPAAG
jgi:hypothetical protein